MAELNLQKIFVEAFDSQLKYWMKTMDYKTQLINFVKTTIEQEKYLTEGKYRDTVFKVFNGYWLDRNETYLYCNGEIYEICSSWDGTYSNKLRPQDFDEYKVECIVKGMADLKAFKFATL